MTKENRIEEELTRLTEIFREADESKLEAAATLLQNAAFMKVTLEDLQKAINAEGVVDEYQNGANQHGLKQSATLQSYNALIKNYAGVMKTLVALLPDRPKKVIYTPPEIREQAVQEAREDEEERQRRIRAEIDRAVAWQQAQRAREKAAGC